MTKGMVISAMSIPSPHGGSCEVQRLFICIPINAPHEAAAAAAAVNEGGGSCQVQRLCICIPINTPHEACDIGGLRISRKSGIH